MQHAVILAGGSGTRLWPLSRRMRPKQLLPLFNGLSLLQHARRRLVDLFPPANIWVITSAAYLDQVAAQLPDLPRENLIGEPVGRDTANAIGLAAGLVAGRDQDAIMGVFTADHLISPQDEFASAIRTGVAACQAVPDRLVTFGITPRGPHTGYGYIRRGEPVAPRTFRVAEFREKPTRELAETYVTSGQYYWNSGIFVWHTAALLSELRRQLPDNATILAELAQNWDSLAGTDAARQRFERLRRISIDYAVMEKARHVVVVQMDCEWRDLGSWDAVASAQAADEHGNVTIGERTMLLGCERSIVVTDSGHLVVLLGGTDLAVIHSGDATLVCRTADLERIKDLAALRVARYGDQFE